MAPSERARRGALRLPSRLSRSRLVVAAGVALAMPLVVACNGLLGLDEFEKGECPGAVCGDGGNRPDRFVEAGPDVVREAGPDVRGSDPVSWAKWPMPNYGDGGAGSPPRPPKLVATAGVVTDEVSTLVWRQQLLESDTTATDADARCRAAPNGPWRAPKRIELITLLDYSSAQFKIDSQAFPLVKNSVVWTTSEVRPFIPGKADQPYWVVNFGTGEVESLAGNANAKVLCVRAK